MHIHVPKHVQDELGLCDQCLLSKNVPEGDFGKRICSRCQIRNRGYDEGFNDGYCQALYDMGCEIVYE